MSFSALAKEFAEEAIVLLGEAEEALLSFERGGENRSADLGALRRVLHTLKGNAGLIGAQEIQAACHAMEDLAAGLEERPEGVQELLRGVDCLRQEVREILDGRPVQETLPSVRALAGSEFESAEELPSSTAQSTEGTLRVPQERVDRLVAIAGELMVHNTRLQRALKSGSLAECRDAGDALDAVLRGLHGRVLELRTIPVGPILLRYRRIVRDEALAHGKKVELEVHGTEVEIDKAVLDRLGEILGHLVRNAVVHGIESPEERMRRGKPAAGKVILRARTHGSQVVLSVEDDGRGLDRDAIRERAEALGLDPSLEASQLIFEPGFSTATLSQSAGRGVGLDAVHKEVVRLGGSVVVESDPGAGSRFLLSVPTSIALERALLCGIGDEIYAVPTSAVVEASRIEDDQVRWMGEGRALEYRGTFYPLIDPKVALELTCQGPYAVFIQAGATAALRVDSLLGQQDFVFQALDPSLCHGAPVDAAALLADGTVVLRLAPDRLAQFAAGRGNAK